MKNDVSVIFFDLFFTLVTPKYFNSKNENDVLNLSTSDWEKYAEDEKLYFERATGKVKNPRAIIQRIIDKMNISVDRQSIDEILQLRKKRMEQALTQVDPLIIHVLSELRKGGKRLCLVSNSDSIDSMYWQASPLYQLFDDAIFSWNVGCLKPQTEIYNIALDKMNVDPSQSLFVGDGSFDELKGARNAGIRTVLTSFLLKRGDKQHRKIMKDADYYIQYFSELIPLV
ncbi:HAD family hydrolase [Sporolactobacillus sp. STCC-11]|uniref:HAD family hydrolase n=1 Tax=Sporolactobacillus caesalpiniae TaxID=3230362 RepID=UPI003396B54B